MPSAFFQTRLDEKPALTMLETALKENPNDPEILLALGTVHESLAELMRRRLWGKGPSRLPTAWTGAEEQDMEARRHLESSSGKHFKRAEAHYRKALAAAPAFAEARLRLGHVLYRRGDDVEALRQFEWVQTNALESPFGGWAFLFAGRVHEHGGRIHEALSSYRAAVRAKDDEQLFLLALSHALLRSGDDHESWQVMERGLRLANDPRNPQGGLWDYFCKRAAFSFLVEQLRSEVLQ